MTGRTTHQRILPGSTIGILGGGQLGRMFAMEARRMGYHVHIFDPVPGCPAGQVSDKQINASFEDLEAIGIFIKGVDVVSIEFENLPVESLRWMSRTCHVRPSPEVLFICQNREREKSFLRENGFPSTRFVLVDSCEALHKFLPEIGLPAVLKTTRFGYDGKGQVLIKREEEAVEGWNSLGAQRCILEAWVNFRTELSVIVARGLDGELAVFDPVENVHRNHILAYSVAPARIREEILASAQEIAKSVAETLDLIGLLTVEFFLDENEKLLINELAPRPHNSGHHTLDACVTSQFEQHLRAICGLRLGATDALAPAVMVNLLGEFWQSGQPDWERILNVGYAKLHLYGKTHPSPGRKMGHVTFLGCSEPPRFFGL